MKKKVNTARNMAPRRQTEASTMKTAFPAPEGEPLVHLTVQVPESLRRQLKQAAAAADTSIREIVLQGITTELRERNNQ